MKETLIIYNKPDNAYVIKSSSYQMDILGHLLTRDIGYSGSVALLREWALQDNNHEIGTNIQLLTKEKDQISISFAFADELYEEAQFLKMPKQSFIHILDEWEKACKEKPQEVVITREGDQFIFEKKF